jgi:single-strand DNA-binding protein
MNKVFLIGRLVADPDTRYTQSGVAVTSFRLAVDRRYKDQSGEKKTDFINCVSWRKLAEIITQYCHKGKQVACEGELNQKQWEKDGETRYSYEVTVNELEFIGSKNDNSGSGNSNSNDGNSNSNNGDNNSNSGNGQQNGDPDLPF